MTDPKAPEGTAEAAWVDRPEGLRDLARRVAAADLVALDTESNSLHAYRERTCVVQVTVGDETALVDPLALGDLGPLRDAFDRPDVETVFHGGDYDVAVLSRDHGFAFRHVFDTMIAATLLGEEKVGLADLVRAQFGVEMDKRHQTADWARRPLPPEMLEYLRRDTAYLLGLRERLHARLAERDLLEEAGIEFRRLAQRRGKTAELDPEGWRRLKGAERLEAPGRAVLRALHLWREGEAERRDLPPFKVLPPLALVAVAREAERGGDFQRALHPGDRRRHGAAVVGAVRDALAAAERGEAPRPEERPTASPEEKTEQRRRRAREDALKDWRREEAARRGVPNVVVLPNPALQRFVAQAPASVADVAADPDLGPKRTALYAEAILAALATT